MGVRAVGRSRARRANRGGPYIGRRFGIPPNRGYRPPNRGGGRRQQRRPQRYNPYFSAAAFQNSNRSGSMRTTTTTRASNVGQYQDRMQQGSMRNERGTEGWGNLWWQKNQQASEADPNFHLILNQTINPAEPSTFTALSAIANQYQRFKTGYLAVTFLPTQSATQNGQIAIAVAPNSDAADPQSLQDMQALYGCRIGPVFGSATTLNVPVQTLQQAYNVQIIDKPQFVSSEEPISVSGKLFIAAIGVTSTEDSLVLGTLTVSYQYQFSTRQLTQGSNSLAGRFGYTGANNALLLDESCLLEGHSPFRSVKALDVGFSAIQRNPGKLYLEMVKEYAEFAIGAIPALSISNDEASWTVVAPEEQFVGAEKAVATWLIPRAKYVKIVPADSVNEVTCRFRHFSVPSYTL